MRLFHTGWRRAESRGASQLEPSYLRVRKGNGLDTRAEVDVNLVASSYSDDAAETMTVMGQKVIDGELLHGLWSSGLEWAGRQDSSIGRARGHYPSVLYDTSVV